jgi:hypothetical protein
MNFQRFGWNLIWKTSLNSIWIGTGHVASCDRTVPLRLDRACEALDLKGLGRIWLKDTPLVKWIYRIHWISIGRAVLKGKRAHRAELGFRRCSGVLRTGGLHRRQSGGFWSSARLRWVAGWHGEPDGVDDVLDCILVREMEAAGARYGGSKLRVTTNASIPDTSQTYL